MTKAAPTAAAAARRWKDPPDVDVVMLAVRAVEHDRRVRPASSNLHLVVHLSTSPLVAPPAGHAAVQSVRSFGSIVQPCLAAHSTVFDKQSHVSVAPQESLAQADTLLASLALLQTKPCEHAWLITPTDGHTSWRQSGQRSAVQAPVVFDFRSMSTHPHQQVVVSSFTTLVLPPAAPVPGVVPVGVVTPPGVVWQMLRPTSDAKRRKEVMFVSLDGRSCCVAC